MTDHSNGHSVDLSAQPAEAAPFRIPAYAPRRGVEALYFNGSASSATPIIQWLLNSRHTASYHDAAEPALDRHESQIGKPYIAVRLDYGNIGAHFDMFAGYWIVKGTEGEFTQWRDDSFKESFSVPQVMVDFVEYDRKPKHVKAIEVTLENMDELALVFGGSTHYRVIDGERKGDLIIPLRDDREARLRPGWVVFINEDDSVDAKYSDEFYELYAETPPASYDGVPE